jgi:hypothetical protein
MNKQNQNQFNPNQEAVLQYVPDFQTSSFTIVGLGETLLPIAEAVERSQTHETVQHASHVAKTAVAGAMEAVELTGHRATIAAKLHDLRFGTHMLDALRERRALERDLRFAGSLGLLTDEVCAKHRKALDQVKDLR